jgi:hypothetical protein
VLAAAVALRQNVPVRPLLQTLLTVVLTAVLAILIGGLVQAFLNGGDFAAAFTTEAPTVLLIGGSLSMLLLIGLLLLANIRAQRGGALGRFWVQVGLLVLASAVGTVAVFLLGLLAGATGAGGGLLPLFAGIAAVSAGIWITIGGIVALVLVHFLIAPRVRAADH